MDVDYPFATPLSRRQLLYRLPTTPAPGRLLIVSGFADGEQIGSGWTGAVVTLDSSQLEAALAQSRARFDAVALPGLLSALAAPLRSGATAGQLLRMAHAFLVPGGVVVGHLENAFALRRAASLRGLAPLVRAALRPGVVGSAQACTRALVRAGFVEPECYYVQPSLAAPMGLIPCDPVPARAQFLRAVRSAQGNYSRPAFVARLLIAHLGLGGMQQQELFFWARTPC
jgi:hypothetical protein